MLACLFDVFFAIADVFLRSLGGMRDERVSGFPVPLALSAQALARLSWPVR